MAPVFRHDNAVDYYLPPGRWTHFFTGEAWEGCGWQRESYDFFSLPLWVRPNSIIPVGNNDSRPDYDFADGVTFHVFGLGENTAVSCQITTLQGQTDMTLHVHRKGDTLTIEAEGATKPWRVLLRGGTAVTAITGGTHQPDEQGTLLLPGTVTNQLTVQLA